MAELGYLIVILFFLLTNAFFAGIETGVISIHRMRLRHFVRRGEPGSKLLHEFLEDSDRLLGTTLVGNNVSLVIISVMVTSMAVDVFPRWGEIMSTVVVSVFVLVFCEYIPKIWFRNRPLERSRRFAGILRLTELFFLPFSKVVIMFTRLLVPGPKESFSKPIPFVTIEDLKILAKEGEKDGVLSSEEHAMISRVFDLSDKTADQIMIPLEEMIKVESNMTISELFDVARKSKYTRMPVWDSDSDKYTGVINVFYVLSLDEKDHQGLVKDYLRPPLFISEKMPLDDIFPKLRRSRQPVALVNNDQGKVLGMVTTEDILEEIVGKL